MKEAFKGESLDISPRDLAGMICQYYEKAVGEPLKYYTMVYVERFSHGGMSSGSVSGEFWICQGIPTLIDNFKKIKSGYPVVTLCGSTRFKDEFIETQKRLTLEGNIVISVGLFGHSGDDEVWDGMDEGTISKTKEMLDDMHKRKIDLSDSIYVINVGGYIGDSTRSEIEYAKRQGKEVMYNKDLFNKLYAQKEEIENKLGLEPDWQRLDGKKASRVLYRLSGLNFDDHSNYDSLMNEMIDKAVLFSNVFKKYV